MIDDPTKVFKIIKETEAEEGYDGKMDKKSLQRILTRLATEGQVKNILVKLSFGERNKTLHFICDPGIDEGDEIIRSFHGCRSKIHMYSFYNEHFGS